MRGLIFKEFYIARKKHIYTLIFMAAVFVISALFYLSLAHGNLARLQEYALTKYEYEMFDSETLEAYYYIAVYILFAIAVFANLGQYTYELDRRVKFDLFEFASPLSEKKIAGAQYLSILISFAGALLLGIINALLISKISGYAFTSEIIKNYIIIFTAGTVALAIEPPLLYRFKSLNAMLARVVPVMFVIATPFALWLKSYIKTADDIERFKTVILPQVRDAVLPFTPLIIIAGVVIGYFASAAALKRREN